MNIQLAEHSAMKLLMISIELAYFWTVKVTVFKVIFGQKLTNKKLIKILSIQINLKVTLT